MDEGAALRLDSVKGFVTHEKSSIGFCPLEGENALEIIPCGGEQIQVVGDILIIIEVIFCKEDGKLGLNAKAGAKGLLQKIMFPKRPGCGSRAGACQGSGGWSGKAWRGKRSLVLLRIVHIGEWRWSCRWRGCQGRLWGGKCPAFPDLPGNSEGSGHSRKLLFRKGIRRSSRSGHFRI